MVLQSKSQHLFSLNVCAWIPGDHLLGPVFIEQNLTGEVYEPFLRNQLHVLLNDVLLDIIRRLWSMYDGVPPHFGKIAMDFLDKWYQKKWIGCGPTTWPHRSPNLNPNDYYLWGHLKAFMYSIPYDSVTETHTWFLRPCLKCTWNIWKSPTIWESNIPDVA